MSLLFRLGVATLILNGLPVLDRITGNRTSQPARSPGNAGIP